MSTEIDNKKATAKESLTVGAQKAVAKAKAAQTWWGKLLWLLAGAAMATGALWLTGCTVSWSIGADGAQRYEHTIVVPEYICK